MKKEPLLVSFCSSKGGAGKSTYTTLAASFFTYVCGIETAVLDCDNRQWSVFRARVREMNLLKEVPPIYNMMASQFEKTGKKLYPVIQSDPTNGIEDFKRLIKHDERNIEIVFVDMPGSSDVENYISMLTAIDYLFVPIKADMFSMEVSLSFINAIRELMKIEGCSIRNVHPFWIEYDGREKTVLYEQYNELLDMLSIERLQTIVPSRKRFGKELFADSKEAYRSTILAPDNRFIKEGNLRELFMEIYDVINRG